MMISTLRIATRGSALALRQTSRIAERLRAAHPYLDLQIVEVTTKGDKDKRPFSSIGGKGLFVAEVEHALIDGRADVAIHSAKDLTAELAPGCSIVCIPERISPEDVIVGGDGDSGMERLGRLTPGSIVGTSSMRRRSLLNEARSDLEVVELRGNLDTRLRKVAEGAVTVAILARAGLERLGSHASYGVLDDSMWVPAPAQGALAVEALDERGEVAELLAPLEDARARAEVVCERAFSRRMEGGCSVPLGCRAKLTDRGLVATGFLGTPDGVYTVRDRISGPPGQAQTLGQELAQAMIESGGEDILAELKDSVVPEVPEP